MKRKTAYVKVGFADNGWMDWRCSNCNKLIRNEDVHVRPDIECCPYCNAIILGIIPDEKQNKRYFQSIKEYLDEDFKVKSID